MEKEYARVQTMRFVKNRGFSERNELESGRGGKTEHPQYTHTRRLPSISWSLGDAMTRKIIIGIAGVLLFAISAVAQQKKPYQVFFSDKPDERASTRILFWDADKNEGAGEIAINYGRPEWKKEYEDQAAFDGFTKGKTWRFGNNYWTTLDTSIPVKIAGKSVAVGLYYLGLHRSADGASWTLAFIDPVKVRARKTDAFDADKAPIEFQAPLTQSEAATSADKLTVILSGDRANHKSGTLVLRWGKLQFSAPVELSVGN